MENTPKKVDFPPDRPAKVWTPTEIKKALLEKNYKAARFGGKLARSRWAVYCVISGKTRTRAIRKAIAKKIGVKPTEIWPDYDQPTRPGRVPKTLRVKNSV